MCQLDLTPFCRYNSLGEEERKAADSVIDSGILSGFIGAAGNRFNGGEKVQELERLVCETTGSRYAVSVNSWTSGLFTILSAIGIGQGDEVITTPWTMCATATTIVARGAIPVFADIRLEDYNIDPIQIEKLITTKTKAIVAVDIFGYTCNYDSIRKIADKYKLVFVTDSAQAWHSFYNNNYASTCSDIGGFSLNYHKQINCGEGGIIITNNKNYARRCQLIRNHGETALINTVDDDNKDVIGFNFRLGEIEAAIAIEQIKKLPKIMSKRLNSVNKLNEFFWDSDSFVLPLYDKSNTSSYYKYPMRLSKSLLERVDRSSIAAYLREKKIPIIQEGYANLIELPIFQRIAKKHNQLAITKLTNARKLHSYEYLGLSIDLIELDDDATEMIINVFKDFEAEFN